eukprot:g40767.t1
MGVRKETWSTARRPVRCVQTQEVFPSISAAAKSISVVPNAIKGAIHLSRQVGGLNWVYVEQEAAAGDT